jgi:hypothetical protein
MQNSFVISDVSRLINVEVWIHWQEFLTRSKKYAADATSLAAAHVHLGSQISVWSVQQVTGWTRMGCVGVRFNG